MNDANLLLATLVLALSVFLTRLIPLALVQRRLRRHAAGGALRAPGWIENLGPLLIAALLGVSLVPGQRDFAHWLAMMAGVAATVAVWRLARGLSLPIIAGVLGFALLIWLSGG